MAFVDFKKFESISELARKEFGYHILGGSEDRISSVCPHHEQNEKNKKGHHLHFNNVKGCFFCYVCEKSGRIHTGGYVQLVMLNTGMTQGEAFKWLCTRYGIEKENSGVPQKRSVKDIRRQFCEEAHKAFFAGLKKADGKFHAAYQYLTKCRGFATKTLAKFRVGAIVDNTVVRQMLDNGYTEEELLEAGVLKESNRPNQKFWCPFFNRITVMAGNNIYGRAIPQEGESAKRLPHLYTTGENSIFNESSIRPESGRDLLFVVESIFDAMTIQQYINKLDENWAVVATLGTKGIKQEALVEKMKASNAKTICLIPDADPWYSKKNGGATKHGVGQLSGLKMAKAFSEAGLNVRIALLPDNSDPNDLSKNHFPTVDFRDKIAKKAVLPIQYQIWIEGHYLDLTTTSGKDNILSRSKKLAEFYGVQVKKPFFKWLAEFAGLSISDVENAFSHTFEKKAVMDYVRKCLNAGKSDEEIMSHIKKLIHEADKNEQAKNEEFDAQVDSATD
jgi:DNA primase